MKIQILFIILFLSICSCNATKNPIYNYCKGFHKNGYKSIRIEKIHLSSNDSITVNEVKYECVKTGLYLMKGMYDRFGKWDYHIKNSNNNKSYLVWSNVQLFENDTMKFSIVASGNKGNEPVNASVLAFNQQSQDLFNENSPYKSKLITYFSEMIKSNNSRNKDFYDVYWKSIDPVMWENHKRAIEIQNNY